MPRAERLNRARLSREAKARSVSAPPEKLSALHARPGVDNGGVDILKLPRSIARCAGDEPSSAAAMSIRRQSWPR